MNQEEGVFVPLASSYEVDCPNLPGLDGVSLELGNAVCHVHRKTKRASAMVPEEGPQSSLHSQRTTHYNV